MIGLAPSVSGEVADRALARGLGCGLGTKRAQDGSLDVDNVA